MSNIALIQAFLGYRIEAIFSIAQFHKAISFLLPFSILLKRELDQDAGTNKVEEEKDVKINANKLVDLDEKVVAPKKYNGIIWFVGVFVVLLVVVFAFT